MQIRKIGLKRNPGYTRAEDRCLGGVSIPCRPVIFSVNPISRQGKSTSVHNNKNIGIAHDTNGIIFSDISPKMQNIYFTEL
jgi:hypothetical protein